MEHEAAPCPRCGAYGDSDFCNSCGHRRAGAQQPTSARGAITFLGQAIAVLALVGTVGYVAWDELSVPTRELSEMLSEALSIDPADTVLRSCERGGSLESIGCTTRAVSLSLIGVLTVAAALLIFRVPLLSACRRIVRHLPTAVGSSAMSALAALVFAMTYSNIHPAPELTGDGIVRVDLFPAIIGLLALSAATLGNGRNSAVQQLLEIRDRIPALVRVIVVLAVPIAAGRLMLEQVGGLSNMAQEQLVIVLSTLVGALAFIPRPSGEVDR